MENLIAKIRYEADNTVEYLAVERILKLIDESKNIELTANDLKSKAENFVDTRFNSIQLNVLEIMAGNYDGHLSEHIREEEPDYLEFIGNYGLPSEFKSSTEQECEEATTETLKEFCENESSFDDWKNEQSNENYPMWNTCFEFKEEPSETVIQAAIDAGFGVIEGMEDFKTTLFVAGCGYSFYGAHWIPLFLNLPWNTDIKESTKGVKFDMM